MVGGVDNIVVNLVIVVFVCIAAVSDWRTRKIPNRLIVLGFIAALGLALFVPGAANMTDAAMGFGLGLLLLLPGFALGFTGAGDVKLMAVVGGFVGTATVLEIFAITALFGAIQVLLMRVAASRNAVAPSSAPSSSGRYKTMLNTFFVTGRFTYFPPSESSVLSRRLPLAPLVALSVITVLFFDPFGR